MKFAGLFAFVATAATTAACDKVPVSTPRAPMPEDVVAILTVPQFDATMPGYYAFADAVKEGEGAALRTATDEAITAELDREAIDWARPMHLVLVAPATGGGAPDVVYVAAARDAAKLAKRKNAERDVRASRGWVTIGKPSAVERTWRWSLGVLATEAAPATTRLTIFPTAVRKHWNDALRAELDPGDSKAKAFLRDAVVGLVEQAERVDANVELRDETLTVDVALVPRAGTPLAAVLAAQQPATFAVLERLPLDSAFSVMAAHLSLGQFAAPLRELFSSLLIAELGDFGPRSAALLEMLWANSTGEYAGATVGGGGVINAIEVADATRVRAELETMAQAVTTVDFPAARLSLENPTHADVPFTIAKATKKGSAETKGLTWGAWDGLFVLTLPDDDGAVLRAVIDSSRTKSAAPPPIAKALADARARRDSFVWTMDFLGGAKPPAEVALGVRDGAGHLWARLPAAQLKIFRAMSPSPPD